MTPRRVAAVLGEGGGAWRIAMELGGAASTASPTTSSDAPAERPGLFAGHTLLARLGEDAETETFLAVPRPDLAPRAPLVVVTRSRTPRPAHECGPSLPSAPVDSPHVARLVDVGRVDSTSYVVAAYIAGWSLADLVTVARRDDRRLPLAVTAALLADLLSGLQAMHDAGERHGDLRPAKLLIGRDGRLRVLPADRLRARERATSVADDLRATAAVALELLTRLPDSPRAGPGRAPQELPPDPPDALAPWLARALDDAPVQRFEEARHMRGALLRLVAPAPAPRVGALARAMMRGSASQRSPIDGCGTELELRTDGLVGRPRTC